MIRGFIDPHHSSARAVERKPTVSDAAGCSLWGSTPSPSSNWLLVQRYIAEPNSGTSPFSSMADLPSVKSCQAPCAPWLQLHHREQSSIVMDQLPSQSCPTHPANCWRHHSRKRAAFIVLATATFQAYFAAQGSACYRGLHCDCPSSVLTKLRQSCLSRLGWEPVVLVHLFLLSEDCRTSGYCDSDYCTAIDDQYLYLQVTRGSARETASAAHRVDLLAWAARASFTSCLGFAVRFVACSMLSSSTADRGQRPRCWQPRLRSTTESSCSSSA